MTLFWQALDPDTDYYEFTQVLEGWDVYASLDGPPVVKTHYTRLWERDEVYREERTLTVSPDTPTGSYEIWVGWFLPDGDRLSVIADDGRILEGWHVLGNIRVEANEG